ncbi:MAG: HDOD domain-containing protein [Oscillospiraceae bacterium]|nr:HDOD domain-containing protein [Oscillospiraceae bacterium]
MNTYIARQPIFNMKKQIFGYELLFRGGDEDFYRLDANTDHDQATSHVIIESFFSRGIETITGGKPAFVNFTANLLLENTATLFPRDQLIVEILETITPTPEIIAACRELHRKGYKLALDDFTYTPELEPLIELSRIIKFDFIASTPQEIAQMMRQINLKGKWLLAEKIETNEMFDLAMSMGFRLFQGYFFSKPETMSSRTLSPLKFSYIALMREASAGEEINIQRVSKAIRDDVALSYKLLRLVNSAFYGLRNEVTDISRAIAVLGSIELRKWIFMIALMGLSSDKPDEIIKMSMIRGRVIENLNTKFGFVKSDESAFQVGLFSMLDVLMDVRMATALEGIHLAQEVTAALIYQTGPLYDLLELVVSIERSDWDKTDTYVTALNINADEISEIYLDAVKWCNDLAI